MPIYYPPLVLSAIFFAAIVVNLNNKDYATVFGLALLAIPSTLFLTFLSHKGLNVLAYILLLVPIVVVIAGYEMGVKNSSSTPPSTDSVPVESANEDTPDRIEPKEGVKEHCIKCKVNPCMCPYKPPTS
uniref:Uncharacterized protein n=1 Tax=viral metagenome TaxID=1070528 RepID=A0A6C0IG36_9ZZZZ